jgi:Domain of unknown function (DUF4258)
MNADKNPSDRFQLSSHALLVIRKRGIELAWIEITLTDPTVVEPDRVDPQAFHALREIPEFGSRILRVVYNPDVEPPLVITAFFDRSLKGKL